MNRTAWTILALVLLGELAGCAGVSKPNWTNPGTAAQQQKRAERFDPYPDPNMAPEAVGVRPREYQVPPPETERARWTVPSPTQGR